MIDRIDVSKELTPSFFKVKHIKKGSVLVFQDAKGKKTELKIVRLNRKKKVCICEPIQLYTEDEINDMPRDEAEGIISGDR